YDGIGNNYPLGFVRWTEQRNFEAVLQMMADGTLDLQPLIRHRFVFAEAARAYELLYDKSQPQLGILLEYSPAIARSDATRTVQLAQSVPAVPSTVRLAFLGAGNYAGRVLIPAFAATSAKLQAISSSGGVTAAHFGRKFGFARATT